VCVCLVSIISFCLADLKYVDRWAFGDISPLQYPVLSIDCSHWYSTWYYLFYIVWEVCILLFYWYRVITWLHSSIVSSLSLGEWRYYIGGFILGSDILLVQWCYDTWRLGLQAETGSHWPTHLFNVHLLNLLHIIKLFNIVCVKAYSINQYKWSYEAMWRLFNYLRLWQLIIH